MNGDAKKRYKDIDFPFYCPITNRKFHSSKGLSCYVTKTIKIDHKHYYDLYVNHRDSSCFFCGNIGEFISISKGYRNLCNDKQCLKKSFKSHSVEGFMYRNVCSREDAQKLFELENIRQLKERVKTQNEIRKNDPSWDKKRSRNCIEFWINKGLTKEEAELEVNNVMIDIHEKTSIKLKSNPEKYASKYPTKIEYYIQRGFSESEAKQKISQIQNRFSRKICIEKYGVNDGVAVFQERQVKWQKSLSENGNIKGGYSKISQILFMEILNKYDITEVKNVFFWTKNKEYLIKSDKSVLLYDFTDISRKKIIEYNGDQYHANPNIYNENDTPHPYHKESGYSAKDIWERDNRKTNFAKNEGFSVLVIWDSEYRKYPQQTLEKCIRFINE